MTPEPDAEPRELIVGDEDAGARLDTFLVGHLSGCSRVRIRRAITSGGVAVDGQRRKVAYRLRSGQHVTVRLPAPSRQGPAPEPIPLDVLYEDEGLAVVNKPAGMVVHPSKGHWSGTLVAALAYHFDRLSEVGGAGRPGIVHRLDRDTSGVIVVAKTDAAHLHLAAQFEQRSVAKEYDAIVAGIPDRDRDWIEQPIGVHPYQREKMAIRNDHATSREASTFYEVQARFPRARRGAGPGFAHVRVRPRSGRTHQIRVHLAHVGCPVLCDRLYGGRARMTRGELEGSQDATVVLERQALHASRLELHHPDRGERMVFAAPLPDDLQRVLAVLQSSVPSDRP